MDTDGYDRTMSVLRAISAATTAGVLAQLVAAIVNRHVNWPLFIATIAVSTAAELAWVWLAWNRH